MKVRQALLLVAVTFIIIAMAATSLFLLQMTAVNPIVPLSAALIIALLPVKPLAKKFHRLIPLQKQWFSTVILILLSFTFILTSEMTANYVFRSKETRTEIAVVTMKKTEQRSRSRRVGRRYVSSGSYTVYKVVYALPDGYKISRNVNPGKYSKIHKGDTHDFKITRGLFGWPIITD